jgi:hypothetical protein
MRLHCAEAPRLPHPQPCCTSKRQDAAARICHLPTNSIIIRRALIGLPTNLFVPQHDFFFIPLPHLHPTRSPVSLGREHALIVATEQ